MAIWGVLRLREGADAAAHDPDVAVAAGVARHLDGLVAVAEDAPVREVLARLPESVTQVVELDPSEATDPSVADVLAGLIGAVDGEHAAVVSARPLADALKRVEGDVVVDGIDRDGVLTPRRLAVMDRSALETAAAAEEGSDALVLLLDAGRAVLVVPPAGAPVTIRAEDA